VTAALVPWWLRYDIEWEMEMLTYDYELIPLRADPQRCGSCGGLLTTSGTCSNCDHYRRR
jgi:hypothetical protein